jgi:Carboxypeptidase regulatory-like domain
MEIKVLSALAYVLVSSAAIGQQVNMGAVNGVVTDSSGAPVPNVKVTATSPALQGEEVFTTNQIGIYRFPALPLGVYKFTFEAAGFSAQVRDQVNVTLGFAATINIQVAPAAQQQTVVVTGETPLVDTQNTAVTAGFTLEQLNEIPNGRDMWSAIGLTPGMNNARIDVGGSQVGNQVPYSSYGYGGQNRVMIDGINTSEGTSGAGFYFDYGSFQEFTVGSAANDASMPVPGNAINAVIKTGGNQFHGDMYYDYENPSFQGHNITQGQILQGAGLGQRIASYYDPNGDLGGPIIRNRFWFYTSIRDQAVGASVVGFPIQNPGTVASYAYDRNVTYKLTGNINNNHRLSHYIQWNPILKPQRSSAAGMYEDAMYYQKAMAWVGNVQYNGVITPKFFVNMLVGTWGYNFPQVPYGAFAGDPGTPGCPCAKTLPPVAIGQLAPRMTDLASNDIAGSYPEVRLDPRRYQVEPSGSYFLDNFLHANHQLKFGYTYEREIENDQYYSAVGGVTETFRSTGLPDFSTPYQVTINNMPRLNTWVILHHGLYLTDQVKVKRLTLNVGLRWDYYSSGYRSLSLRADCQFCGYFYEGQPLPNGATLPVNPLLQNGKFPDATVSTFPREIAPRIGIAYDLTGKGRTVLKVNYGQYYSYPSTTIASAVSPVQAATAVFNWNNPNNLPFNLNQLGSISGSPNVPQGSLVQPNLKDERFDDMGVVIQHQLTNTLSIEGGFIFRELHYSPETINLALPASLFTVAVPESIPASFDANGNVTATKTITMWDVPKNLITASQNQISSPSGNNQVFRNVEVTLSKRLSNRFMAVGSYYWTHTTSGIQSVSSSGAVTNGVATNPDQLINSRQSYSQWTAHIDGSYEAPWDIRISPVFRMQSGTPLTETYAVTGLNIGTFYLPVTPTGTTYSPNLYVFDTRFEKYLTFRERYKLGLFLDVFNIFNSNAANTVGSVISQKSTLINIQGNPDFGQTVKYEGFGAPTLILPPRILKIGARFSF